MPIPPPLFDQSNEWYDGQCMYFTDLRNGLNRLAATGHEPVGADQGRPQEQRPGPHVRPKRRNFHSRQYGRVLDEPLPTRLRGPGQSSDHGKCLCCLRFSLFDFRNSTERWFPGKDSLVRSKPRPLSPHTVAFKLCGLFDILAFFSTSRINLSLNFDQDLPVS